MSVRDILRLARLEWRYGSSKSAFAMTGVGLLGVALTHLVLPRMPAYAIELLRVGFLLDDLAAVLLLNDLFAIYFATYFLGVAGALGVVLLARQERQLELILVKPVRTEALITARALPVLVRTAVAGLLVSFAAGALVMGARGSLSMLEASGAGAALTALALFLVGVVLLLFVKMRDPFDAMLVASGLWLVTAMPLVVLLYQPEAFVGHEGLRERMVMATVIWHAPTFAWLGFLLLAVACLWSLACAYVSGVILSRGDAQGP